MSSTGNEKLPILNHMGTQGKALWATIIGKNQRKLKEIILFMYLHHIFMLYYVPLETPLVHY